MKSERTEEIDAFWDWFTGVAPKLVTSMEDHGTLLALDQRIRTLDRDLSWEVGPSRAGGLHLVISPNLDRELQSRAQEIVARAPVLSGWSFLSARPRKDWAHRFEMATDNGQAVQLDASTWTFVMLRYPEGAHEVILHSPRLPTLTDAERWQAAAIVLEGILGEQVILDKIEHFDLVDKCEARFDREQRPIQLLLEAFGSQDVSN